MAVVTLETTITFAISVKDRHASADWYAKMLGFSLLYHADDAGWSEMATFTTGVTLGLGEQTAPQPGNAMPVFGIADLDAGRAALETEGVRFDGPSEEIPGMVKIATCYDLDNNAFMLAQDLSGGA